MTTLRLASIEHRELVSARTGEPFAFSAVVSELIGVRSLFIHHDVIPPGRRASGRHFHTERDEVVIVLEGTVQYDRGGARGVAHAGDAIGFPAGEASAHAIENHSSEPATILVVSNAAKADVTIHVEHEDVTPVIQPVKKKKSQNQIQKKKKSRAREMTER